MGTCELKRQAKLEHWMMQIIPQQWYGIQTEMVETGVCTYVALIPAIFYDRDFVDSLAQRCDRGQFGPVHLLNVVLDALP